MNANNYANGKKKRNFVRPVDHIKLTPWKDEWEWKSVSHGIAQALSLVENGRVLHSPEDFDCGELEQALEKCHVWKLRQMKLPHAIDCSYNLSSLLYQDYCSLKKSPEISESTLQLAYATSVIRSVNGLADQLQQNRALAAPVSYLCQQLGLPGWIVDLRHESAHNELPSLPSLRLAAHTLLLFFHERYWMVIQGHREERHEHATLLIKDYITAAVREHRNNLLTVVTITEQQKREENQAEESDTPEKQTFEDEDISWMEENFYAALHRPTKKKAKKKAKKRKKSESDEKVQRDCHKLSTLEIANTFVKTLQQDIAYRAVIDYLVWSDDEKILSTGSPQLYQTLIQRICQVWPGFASTFVTHCVEYQLLHASHSEKVAEWVDAVLSYDTTQVETLPLKGLLKRLNENVESKDLVHVLTRALGEVQGAAVTKADWSLVEDWESCAIGSLPGHAS